MKRFLLHSLMLILISITLGELTSCISDNDTCLESYVKDDSFKIRFQIMTKNSGNTRSADIAGDIEGSGVENYLNIDNIRYFLFDKDLKYLSDITANATTLATNDEFTVYDVVAKVEDPYFKENINGTLDFYLLVVANYFPWNVTFPNITSGVSVHEIFNQNFIMRMNPTMASVSSSSLMQPIEYGTSARFPMSGMQRFTISGSMLLTANERIPYDLTMATGKYVNLLRSLAKIEIVDKINIGEKYDPEKDETKYRIKEANLNGFYSQGCLLPSFNQWMNGNVDYPETQQVSVPTIPATASYVLPPILNEDNTIVDAEGLSNYTISFAYDPYASQLRDDKCRVFSCYIYEYKMPQGITAEQQPYFIVKIQGPGENEGEVVSLEYPVRMAKYEKGETTSANNLEELLRNHIYRFEITGIQQDLTVNWTVCEMDQATSEIEFN